MELKYIVKENDKYKTINEILFSEFHLSNRLHTKLINLKQIYKNGKIIDTRDKVSLGDVVTALLNYVEDNSNIVPTKIDLDILYEDEWLLVINKPAEIAVHPSMSHFSDSLSNGVRYYFDLIRFKEKNKTCE